jgi:hypothetical protein
MNECDMDDSQSDWAVSTALKPLNEETKSQVESRERVTGYENWYAKRRGRIARGEALLERVRRPYAEYKRAHPQGKLCHRCAGVDWSLLLPSETSHFCEEGPGLELFRVPESSQELSTSTCPLCLALSSGHVFGKSRRRILQVDCISRFVSYSDKPGVHYRNDNPTHHALRLTLTHTSMHSADSHRTYILQSTCAATQGYVLRKLTPQLGNYEIPRGWLKHCKRHHPTDCNPTFASSIPGLRVFDCNAKKVIAAPEDTAFKYIALSYVWGGVKIPEKEQAGFPATIRDAITVTLELGYRYLWVDQLVSRPLKYEVSANN